MMEQELQERYARAINMYWQYEFGEKVNARVVRSIFGVRYIVSDLINGLPRGWRIDKQTISIPSP